MMEARSFVASSLALLLCASSATAKARFTPGYNAPYRACVHQKSGGTVSFSNGSRDFAIGDAAAISSIMGSG